jgi:tRNA(Ile)-lysidine synthase
MALEEAARRARYGFLGTVAVEQGASSIAVGHNSDDQTETIVMHWLRGAGMAGLRGMLPSTPLSGLRLWRHDEQRFSSSDIQIIRPLLEVSRRQVEEYCSTNKLAPRFDRSNLDTTHFRNRLRHELIPLLETYNPNFRGIARRTARVIADDYALLRSLLQETWEEVVHVESPEAIVFHLAAWRALPIGLQRSTIREAIHRLRRSLRDINWIHTEDAVRALRSKPVGTRVTLPHGLMLTIAYNRFTIANAGYVAPVKDYPQLSSDVVRVTVPGVTPLPSSRWLVETSAMPRDAYDESHSRNLDPWQAFMDFGAAGTDLLLRCRRPGDRFQPLGLCGHEQSIADFMINAKIPRAVRDRLPLLASATGIIWIPGWRIDTRVRVTEYTSAVLQIALRPSGKGPVSHG